MQPKFTLTLFSFLAAITMYAQRVNTIPDYKNEVSKPNANYTSITAAVRQQFDLKRQELIRDGVNPETNNKFREENAQFERWAYFWNDRVNADGSFPSAAQGWINTLQTNPEMITGANRTTSVAAAIWTSLGPIDVNILNGWTFGAGIGRVNVVKRCPGNPGYMLAGTASGGIFKTTDLGSSWTPLTDQFAGLGVSDILFHPTNTQIIYLATGDYDGSHMSSIGIMKSTDGGTSWTNPLAFTLPQSIRLKKLYLDPNFAVNNTIYCTSTMGVYVSTNAGDTWTRDFGAATDENMIDIIKIGPNFFVSDGWGRIFKSTAINTLAAVFTPAPFGSANKLTFAYSPNTPDILYCLFQANPAFAKYTISTDNMSALSTVQNSTPLDGNGVYNSQGGYNQVIVADPTNGQHLIMGEFSGKRSTDGGTNWINYLNGYYTTAGNSNWGGFYVHSDHHYMEFIGPDSLLIGNDGGVYIGKISTGNYKTCFNGLRATQSYSIAVHDPSPNNLMIGNQDNDGSSRKFDGVTSSWYAAQAGDGTSTAISRTNSNVRYVGGTNGSLSFRSDGFETGFSGTDIDKPGAGSFVWPLEMHLTNGTIIYGGFNGLYKMINAPQTTAGDWTNLLSGTGAPTISFINLSNHPVDPLKQRIVVIGSNNTVRKTVDETTWSTIIRPVGVNFNSIYWSRNSDTMLASATGYNAANKIYFSTDAGANWTNITDNFPNILTKKVIRYEGTDTILIATELGVYFARIAPGGVLLRTAGVGWTKFGTGLPNVRVDDIEISYTSKKLVAGTFGRGAWMADLAALGTLPLKDIAFSYRSTTQSDKYNLYWDIKDDNISSTTLERSKNGLTFEPVATFSDGKKQKNDSYPVIVDNGKIYYRIQYTDNLRRTYYSNIIRLGYKQTSSVLIYPNPTSDYVWITSKSIIKTVTIYSTNGIQVTYARPNQNTYYLDMKMLPVGNYIVKIEDEKGGITSEKIVRTK